MKKNTYIFILFICFLHAQPKKHYTYRLDSSSDVSEKLLKLLQIQEYQELEYLDITIIGDQKKIKDGDIFNFVFKNSPDDFDKINLSYTVDQKQEKSRWLPIINKFGPDKFGDPLRKNIIIDEKDILMSPSITLNLTYNNQLSETQIHGDQNESLSKDLKNYEKEFMGLPKYIRSKINMTQEVFSQEGEKQKGLDITLRDIDTEGKKSKILRTNLDTTRFFYQSKDSLFAQEIRVTNFNDNVITPYKIWQSSKDMILPDKLQLNGVFGGDLKNGTLINYDNPEEPKTKTFSYKAKNIRLNENIFEFNKDIKPKEASFWRYKGNIRGKDWVFLDSKYTDKFVYLLDEEYAFKKDKEKGKVFAPVESGGESRKTLGDLKSFWVPWILTPIVIFSLIGSL